MSKAKPEMLLWLNDSRGVYIPRDFALSFKDRAKNVKNVSDEDWAILEAGPDHEFYWDTWSEVCDTAIVVDNDGNEFNLWQDGDLWLIPVEMEWNDETGTFEYPSEDEED